MSKSGVYIFLFIWAFIGFGGKNEDKRKKREGGKGEDGMEKEKREGERGNHLQFQGKKRKPNQIFLWTFWTVNSADSEPWTFLDIVKNKIKIMIK